MYSTAENWLLFSSRTGFSFVSFIVISCLYECECCSGLLRQIDVPRVRNQQTLSLTGFSLVLQGVPDMSPLLNPVSGGRSSVILGVPLIGVPGIRVPSTGTLPVSQAGVPLLFLAFLLIGVYPVFTFHLRGPFPSQAGVPLLTAVPTWHSLLI